MINMDIRDYQKEQRDRIAKSFTWEPFDTDIEKARSGVYEDTPENRKLGRVGQKYGGVSDSNDPYALPSGKVLLKRKQVFGGWEPEKNQTFSSTKDAVKYVSDMYNRIRKKNKKADANWKPKGYGAMSLPWFQLNGKVMDQGDPSKPSKYQSPSDVGKSEENDIEKARSGVYADTAENRAKRRVGQQYGSRGQQEQPKGRQGGQQEEAKQKPTVDEYVKKLGAEKWNKSKLEREMSHHEKLATMTGDAGHMKVYEHLSKLHKDHPDHLESDKKEVKEGATKKMLKTKAKAKETASRIKKRAKQVTSALIALKNEGALKKGSEERKQLADVLRKAKGRIVKELKNDAKEWGLAGGAAKKVLTGRAGDITPEDKKAIKNIMVHMAIVTTMVVAGKSGEQSSAEMATAGVAGLAAFGGFAKAMVLDYLAHVGISSSTRAAIKKAEENQLKSGSGKLGDEALSNMIDEFIDFIENGDLDEKQVMKFIKQAEKESGEGEVDDEKKVSKIDEKTADKIKKAFGEDYLEKAMSGKDYGRGKRFEMVQVQDKKTGKVFTRKQLVGTDKDKAVEGGKGVALSEEKKKRVLSAKKETQALLDKEKSYSKDLQDKKQIEFLEGHIKKLNDMLGESSDIMTGVEAAIAEGKDSLMMHIGKDGNFTPERQKLHDQIVSEFLKNGKVYKKGDVKVSVMMGGAPANGKSSVIKSGAVSIPDGLVGIDADEIKAKLPEYQHMAKAKDSRGAAFAHEESSYLSKRIMKEAASKDMGALIDGTGNTSIDSVRKKVKMLKDAGHRVVANYVFLDLDVALKNNEDRFKATGRKVPESYVRKVHGNVPNIIRQAVEEGLFDEIHLYDTNINGKPRKMMDYTDGKQTVHDEKLFANFNKAAK